MVRSKGVPQRASGGAAATGSPDAQPADAPSILLRLQHAGGAATLRAPEAATLKELNALIADALFGGFANEQRLERSEGFPPRRVELHAEPVGATLRELGLANGDRLFVSIASPESAAASAATAVAASAASAEPPPAAKKRAPPSEALPASWGGGGSGKKNKTSASDADEIARKLLVAKEDASASFGVSAYCAFTSAARLHALEKGTFSVSRGSSITVSFTDYKRKLYEETVTMYDKPLIEAICGAVICKQTTSRRRKTAGMPKVLALGEVCARAPSLFWSVVRQHDPFSNGEGCSAADATRILTECVAAAQELL